QDDQLEADFTGHTQGTAGRVDRKVRAEPPGSASFDPQQSWRDTGPECCRYWERAEVATACAFSA
ncbi:MAG: hypothetical protein OXE76_00210, partial [Alphaproteobacteria bacterium]|nr:hypothetical protein [Alphaproteobacteria bacterium]